jgi:membrane AbrB-like protein
MQYLRVVLVAILASLIARFWVHATGTLPPVVWFPPLHGLAFLETLVLILGGVWLGHVSRMPAGMLLVPLVLGTVLHVNGFIDIELPRWLLAIGYLCLGWRTGLRFTREVLHYALRALPQILLAIVTVIVFCGLLGWMLVLFLGVDPLTAYLATSPGGVDAVAIIAASTKVDVSFVMALQFSRLFLVLSLGPVISRFAARRVVSAKRAYTPLA